MVCNNTYFGVNYALSSENEFKFGYQKFKWGPRPIRKMPNGLRDIVSELIINITNFFLDFHHGQSARITGNYLTCWIWGSQRGDYDYYSLLQAAS
jgi:hypothetical protein